MHKGEFEYSEGSELTPYSADTPAPYSVDTKGPEVTAEIQVIAEAENSVRHAIGTLMEIRGMTEPQARWEVMHRIDPERFEDHRKTQRALDIDDKTQVWSEHALKNALPTAESEAKTSIILFDINNFGEVNKILDHNQGNEVLRRAGECIRRASRSYGFDRVFRMGGAADEFVALVSSEAAEAIRNQAERLFGEEVFESKDKHVVTSLSGTFAGTLKEADASLQDRKTERKLQQEAPLDQQSPGNV